MTQVDDAANSEVTFRLTRLLGGLTILDAVAARLDDPNMRRCIKEVRQKIHNLSTYCRKQYGVVLPPNPTTDETE